MKDFSLNGAKEKNICAVVSSRSGSTAMVESILQQDYTNYHIVLFGGAEQIDKAHKYISANALDDKKLTTFNTN